MRLVTGETVLRETGRWEVGPVMTWAMTKLFPTNLLPDSSVTSRTAVVTTTPSYEESPSTAPCLDTDPQLDH